MGLVLLAPPLSQLAVKFGPAEYFSLMVLGLTILVYLAHGSMAKALLMAALGVVLGLIGLDSDHGAGRASPSTGWSWWTAWGSSRSSWACSASPRCS